MYKTWCMVLWQLFYPLDNRPFWGPLLALPSGTAKAEGEPSAAFFEVLPLSLVIANEHWKFNFHSVAEAREGSKNHYNVKPPVSPSTSCVAEGE